jgi:hypothetical protein
VNLEKDEGRRANSYKRILPGDVAPINVSENVLVVFIYNFVIDNSVIWFEVCRVRTAYD